MYARLVVVCSVGCLRHGAQSVSWAFDGFVAAVCLATQAILSLLPFARSIHNLMLFPRAYAGVLKALERADAPRMLQPSTVAVTLTPGCHPA